MTQSRCWDCNNMFESNGYQTVCSVCKQTRVLKDMMEEQAKQKSTPKRRKRIPYMANAPYVVYRPDPNEPWYPEYIPPTPEEQQKKKEIKRLNLLFSIAVDLSLPILWIILWMITSGWITFFSFIAAIYVPVYLSNKQFYWQSKNAKYLYQI